MAEKAGFGFNPNAYGLSAAGQEGSGMNQILTPYDPTKFDRAIVATGEKKKEDAAKQKDVVKPKVEFTDIKKGWQGYFVEEGITLDEKQRDLARKKVDWKVKFDELDPKSADYEKTKNEMLRESANIEYDIESLNFTADQMLQNKEIIDKSTNSIMINPSKYDDVASKKLNTYVQNLPTDQQTQYLQNNILNVPKVDFNWNENFLTPTGGYIKEMFERTIGSPIVGSTVDDNGNFIYKTQKGTSVPLTDLKPTLEALLADTVATTPGLYEYLLGRTTADGKSYAQLAAEAGYDNGNPASFVKYLFKEQTEEFVKQVIPLGDSVTTQQILQPYKGGGNTFVTVDNSAKTPSSSKVNGSEGLSLFGGDQTYSRASYGAVDPKNTIQTGASMSITGKVNYNGKEYDYNGAAEDNSNIKAYQGITLNQNMASVGSTGNVVGKNDFDRIAKEAAKKNKPITDYFSIAPCFTAQVKIDGTVVEAELGINYAGNLTKDADARYRKRSKQLAPILTSYNYNKYPSIKGANIEFPVTLYDNLLDVVGNESYVNDATGKPFTGNEFATYILEEFEYLKKQGYSDESAYDEIYLGFK